MNRKHRLLPLTYKVLFAVITALLIAKEDTAMKKFNTEKLIGKIENKLNLTEKKWYRVTMDGDAYYSHIITEAIKTLHRENRNLIFGSDATLIWYLNMDLEQKKAFELAARDYLLTIDQMYEEQQ